MTRLRYVLYATFLFAAFVLGLHLFYTKNYIVHIVQSLNIDLQHRKPLEPKKPKKAVVVDPHGNGILPEGKIVEVVPEVLTKPPSNTKVVDGTTQQNEKIKVEKRTEEKESKQAEVAKPPASSKPDSSKKEEHQPTSKDKSGFCSKRGENLVGQVMISREIPDMEKLINEYTSAKAEGGGVKKGGLWKPTTCNARVKTAIVIPYRKREEQLKIYLKHMHPILQRQQLHYRIFVIEQADDDPFNRAGLFNVGFTEALKTDTFGCIVFSDVDLLPEDDRNYYGCPTSPRHMSVAVDKFDYRLPYEGIFGGVGAFKTKDFQDINGFSNKFWGWGGEDDDLYKRIRTKGFQLTRPSMAIGRYTMIQVHHFQSHGADPNRMNLLQDSATRMSWDGLSNLKYKLNRIIELPLATVVNVKLSRSLYA